MKGKFHIIIEDKRVKYEFDIKRNITIIRGDSATGKTTLYEMISQYENIGSDSGVNVISDAKLSILSGINWKDKLSFLSNNIIFIDEGNSFLKTAEFSDSVNGSDNYFVIITRENMPNLPYSVDEIYGIKTSAKYAGLKQIYHEFYKIYSEFSMPITGKYNLITEDSNSGYEFWQKINVKADSVISANGKSNIALLVAENKQIAKAVVADGAAFGPEIENIMRLVSLGYNIFLYLPESFEWLVLKSDVLNDNEVREILLNPEDYADSKDYVSWERFFTKILTDKTSDSFLEYSKKTLNSAYLQGKTLDKLINSLPETVRNMIC